MAYDFTINKGSPVFVHLYIEDLHGIANFSEAAVTFTVTGTSISKTTVDNTIFAAHPILTQDDEYLPCFIIRIYPDDIATLPVGEHAFVLSVTDRDVVGAGAPITNTYNGVMTLLEEFYINISTGMTLQIPE